MIHWLPRTLMAFCALMVLGIAYETFAPAGPIAVASIAPRPRAIHVPVLPAFAPPPEDAFASIDARPIFYPKRKPIQDQASVAVLMPSDLSLVGVIKSPETSIALFRNRTTLITMSAKLGESVEGWQLTAVEPTHVTLSGNGTQMQIALDGPANSAPTPAQPAPAAAGNPLPAIASQLSQSAPTVNAVVPDAAKPAASVPPPPPAAPSRVAAAPPESQPTKPSNLLVHTAHGSISAEALKGAIINPATGEPTL